MFQPRLMVFAKHLQAWSLDEAGRRLKAAGFDAIDLTVRPRGYIQPAEAADALPRAAEQLQRSGVTIGMISTTIVDASDRESETLLRTAAALGIRHYKLGYLHHGDGRTIRQLRDEAVARFRELAALNRQLGLVAGFHNHSGKYLGANLYDVAHVLERVDCPTLGAYLDGTHATIEGGGAAWRMGIEMLAGRVVMLAVKDFFWDHIGEPTAGPARRQRRLCPVGQGQVDWPGIVAMLDEQDFAGPTSLHCEYQGKASFKDLSTDQVLEQAIRDRDVVNGWAAREQASV